MSQIISKTKTSHDLRLNENNNITPPLVKSKFTKNYFQYFASKIWNFIPLNVRNANTLSIFRRQYRNYLLNNYKLQFS